MINVKTLLLFSLLLWVISCNPEQKSIKATTVTAATSSQTTSDSDKIAPEAYTLMQQKCYICHMETPDPKRKSQMLAPPMLRVQEHYKPNFSEKSAFVDAITSWVMNPIEKETLMPGAIRKFNLMPKLSYEEKDIREIAAYLYDMDFENIPKMRMHSNNGLSMNNGKKWIIKSNHISQLKAVQTMVQSFKSTDLTAYNELGKEVFQNAKIVLLDKSYSKETFEQLHTFFNGLEQNMHLLTGAQSIEKAKIQQEEINKKFNTFFEYFEGL